MKKALFERIKKGKYARYASFAVWDDRDLDDTSIIEKNIKTLRSDLIIVGLNASGKPTNRFTNFHTTHRGGRDSWVRDVFNRSPWRGAYMTDIIKNDTSSRQPKGRDLVNEKKNAKIFKDELRTIGCKRPRYIIAFGNRTARILKEQFPEWKDRILQVLHYQLRGTHQKKRFMNAVAKALSAFS